MTNRSPRPRLHFPTEHKASHRPARFRPALELLEERTLLSGAGAAFVPGEILIGFEGAVAAAYQSHGSAAALAVADQVLGRFGLHGGRMLALPPGSALASTPLASRWVLPAGMDVPTMIARLYGQPGIAFAEPNYVLQVSATVPNDPAFGELWGLNNTGQSGGTADADIDAPEAWDLTTGSGTVVVAVIDTGVDYTHPDLAANIWTNPGEVPSDGIDNDGNGFIDDLHGWDFANDDNDPFDDNLHGSHVAGTIAAAGNNLQGVVGVTWNTQIMALKFLNAAGSGTTADVIDALNYATMMRNRGVNIVLTNNSYGSSFFSQAEKNAIQASGQAGMLFVAAAGNSNADTDASPEYPAAYDLDNIIAVAATDRSDARASFSNYGAVSVDLGAPGVAILSTVPGGLYQYLDGTSMAAPHVAGVAALA